MARALLSAFGIPANAPKDAVYPVGLPDGAFIPMVRLYWPKETPPSVLDGTWWPPVIQKS